MLITDRKGESSWLDHDNKAYANCGNHYTIQVDP